MYARQGGTNLSVTIVRLHVRHKLHDDSVNRQYPYRTLTGRPSGDAT